MATKKAGGSTQNGRDSWSKRRGVKRFGGQIVNAGEIIVRQKGYLIRPGQNTYLGKDWTIHTNIDGKVDFKKIKVKKFNGRKEMATVVTVTAVAAKAVKAAK
jgi:large subunit ribosomal protein L27